MEKIDTDYKQRNLKSLAKLFKPFNRDWAPLSWDLWTEFSYMTNYFSQIEEKNQHTAILVE